MKLKLIFLLLVISEFAKAQGAWNQKADCDGPVRQAGCGFSIGSKGYFATGAYGYTLYKDLWEWDMASNTWTQKADCLGALRSNAIAFAIGTMGYLGTGRDGISNRYDFYEYNSLTNIWTAKTNFASAYTGRVSAVGFSIGTKGYVAAGYDGSYAKKDLWQWDQATDTWTQMADIGGVTGLGRSSAVGFAIGTKGYVGTGGSGSIVYDDFWEWDQATNIWTAKSTFPGGARVGAVGISIGTKGYIGTGGAGSTIYNDFWEYNQATDTWVTKPNFPGGLRTNSIGFSIGGNGYIGAGVGPAMHYNDLWEYNPNTPVNDNAVSATSLSPSVSCSYVSTTSLAASYSSVGDTVCGGNPDDDVWYTFTASTNVTSAIINVQPSAGYDAVIDIRNSSMQNIACSNVGGNGVTEICNATNLTLGAVYYVRVYHAGTGSGSSTFNICFVTPAVTPIVWTPVANFGGTARDLTAAFSIGSKGYVGTGEDASLSYKNDFWEYDETTDIWTQKANVPGGLRCWATGFSIGTKGYIGTGTSNLFSSVGFNDFYEYDPVTNIWTTKSNVGGGQRYGAVSFSIGTKGYITTGDSVSTIHKRDLWEWDQTTDAWMQKADLPAAGGGGLQAVGFSIGTKGYLGTGQYNGGNKFWEYDPSTNSWTQKANYGGGQIYGAVGFSVSGQGYIGTGFYYPSYQKAIWQYDPSSDTWFKQTLFPGTARYNATAFFIGNNGYVGAGYDGTYKKDFWRFTGGSLSASIIENEANADINVFPNPSTGKFTLKNSVAKGEFSIYNIEGKIIYSSKIESEKTEIDLSYAPKGIYFIVINSSRQMSKRIIIQ